MKPWITRGHRHAEGRCAVIGLPGRFRHSARIRHRRQIESGRPAGPSCKSASEASKGRQVIRSPAVPASSLEFSTALYSAGRDGAKTTLMPGLAASKAGMIVSCQIGQVVVAPAFDGQRHVLAALRRPRPAACWPEAPCEVVFCHRCRLPVGGLPRWWSWHSAGRCGEGAGRAPRRWPSDAVATGGVRPVGAGGDQDRRFHRAAGCCASAAARRRRVGRRRWRRRCARRGRRAWRCRPPC